MIRSQLVTPPAIEPVTLADAKAQARVEHDADDTLIQHMITAARQAAEIHTGRALITQTWRQSGRARGGVLELRRWPVVEVLSVSDEDGPLDAAAWRAVVGDNPCVDVASYWSSDISVEYTAGYGDTADAVPAPIRQWILIAVATMYEHREAEVVGVSIGSLGYVDGLLDPYRVPST